MTGAAASTRATSWSGHRAAMPKAVKAKVHARDRVCRQCGSSQDLEVDHVVPVAEAKLLGWTQEQIDDVQNGQLLCGTCHAVKTRGEIARGIERRKASRQRPKPRHPGLIE